MEKMRSSRSSFIAEAIMSSKVGSVWRIFYLENADDNDDEERKRIGK